MSKHLFIDFETLSTLAWEGIAVDFSVFVFDWERFTENPYSLEEIVKGSKRFKLNAKEQRKVYGYKHEDRTLQFWKEQPPEVYKKIKPNKKDIRVEESIDGLLDYIGDIPISRWWTRNNSFDPVFIKRMAYDCGKYEEFNSKLNHGNVRDIKTWIDAKFGFDIDSYFIPVRNEEYWNKVFKQHMSQFDVAADILRLQMIERAENDMEIVEK